MGKILSKLSLSKQEERVLLLSMSGMGDKEVAKEMGVAFETVRTSWHRIRTKVGSTTRAELIARLVEEGAARALEASASENERLVAENAHRRQAEQRFLAIASVAPIGMFVASSTGECLYVNEEWQRIAGRTAEEAMGRGWLKAIHPEDRERADSDSASHPKPESSLSDIRYLRPDGTITLCRVTASAMKIDGHLIGTVGTVEDVTDRRKAERRLLRAHDFNAAILNIAGCLVIVLDRLGNIVLFNRTCEVATGYSQAELIGRSLFDLLVAEQDRPTVRELFIEPRAGGFPNEKENSWVRHDGSELLLSWSNTALLDADGAVEFVIKTGIDITLQRRLENEVKAKDERFRSFMDHLPAAAFAKDAEGRLTYANKRFGGVFGKSGQSLIGKRDDEFLPIKAARQNEENDRVVFETGRSREAIEIQPTLLGDRRFLSHRFLFSGEDGQKLMGGVALDITPLWEAEQKLRAAAETGFDILMILRPHRDEAGEIVDFVFEFANTKAEQYLARTQKEIVGARMSQISDTEGWRFVQGRYLRLLRTGEIFQEELLSESEGLRGRWVHYQAHAVGEMIVASVRDVHDAKMVHLALEEREERLNQAERLGKVGSYQLDPASGMATWSCSMHEMFEVPPEGPVSPDRLAALVHPEDVGTYRARRDRCRRNGTPLDVRFRVVTESGRTIHIHNTAQSIVDGEGNFAKSMGTVRDVTVESQFQSQLDEQVRMLHVAHIELEIRQEELQQANLRLSELASLDGLTGLKNHHSFQERLKFDVALSTRHGRSLTVALLDVDHFKQFNDTYGHPAGDQLLERLGTLLRTNARRGDFVARYGGEEFALILSATDLAGAMALCEKLRLAIESERWAYGPITASFGCAPMREIDADAATLVAQADRALYRAKANGRNVVQAWVEEEEEELLGTGGAALV